MKCSYSADFGPTPRLEWIFRDINGSRFYIFFIGEITGENQHYYCLISNSTHKNKKNTAGMNAEMICSKYK